MKSSLIKSISVYLKTLYSKKVFNLLLQFKTAELFVFIADNYAIDQVTSMHDDVKISWEQNENQLFLIGSVLIDGPDIDGDPAVRNRIFYTEMPTALKAMRQADRFIFEQYPNIDNTPVLIRFLSENPTYNKTYNFGPIGN